MFRHIISLSFALIVGGCASDANMDSTTPAAGSAATSSGVRSGGAAVAGPTMADAEASTNLMNPSASSKSSVAAAVEEEDTLDTCLARIPQDATVGQKMLAEQTCRRDFASRR
jgi:hypothetical protein